MAFINIYGENKSMLKEYLSHKIEREKQNLPPLSLNPEQTVELVKLIKENTKDHNFLIDLLIHRVPAGVDQAAFVKAAFLTDIANEKIQVKNISPKKSIDLLGTMLGGYNVQSLVKLLETKFAEQAFLALSKITLIFDSFYDVETLHQAGNEFATKLMQSWAEAEWFNAKNNVPNIIEGVVFKVDGETNTDDLSPAQEAFCRADIPLHAQSMLKTKIPNALEIISTLKEKGLPIIYVGDVVGTGSSRKSALNSLQWHMGNPIPFIPNKNSGGIILGGKIAPIFFNTAEDSGALPIECDVTKMNTGDVLAINTKNLNIHINGKCLTSFLLRPATLFDELRAGGRIPLIIGKDLTSKARKSLNLEPSKQFIFVDNNIGSKKGFTLAQKMVGLACGVEGIRPGVYCEPKITTVGSQDTTGAMTRDELKELACLGFSADLVMQSFCHTAAYPKPTDLDLQHTLPDFMSSRGGVSLKAGDGVIHSWLNRMILPDTVGTGGDSHTRFPIGISFPAGSGLVAFAAALGVMPLDMPESVLVKFKGKMQPGITLRDLVNAIPYQAIQDGLLTVAKEGKKNIFSGRILEIEGLPHLKAEQAFELSDASAERSAAACTIKLDEAPIREYLSSNITLLKWMIADGYGDPRTIARRIQAMEAWLNNPELMEADADAEYAEVIEIDLNDIQEPLLACPNDPDDVKPLSEVQGTAIDEVFIGSCMTNIGHYRAAGELLKKVGSIPTRLWIAPPTRMDEHQLMDEGYYAIYGKAGARTEMPGCSLCMGNQARVADHATVVSTATRNFPNRLGNGANVYLASAELAAVASIIGRLPTVAEYMEYAKEIDSMADNIYRYMNFHQIAEFQAKAKEANIPVTEI